jgi:cytochrome c-type biogenesis protein CcmH/NrfG
MLKGGRLVAVALVVLLGIGLAFLPHSGTKKKNDSGPQPEGTSVNEKVQEAVKIITEGEGAPMKGIKLLKEVLEEDPQNTQALYYLGTFSIQSGQFDKAIQRFETLIQIDPKNEEAQFLLGYSLVQAGDTSRGVSAYQNLIKEGKSVEYKEMAQEEINKLKNL